jgi:hypothetical protein
MSCPCPTPNSYVPEPLNSERIANYQNNKYSILNNWVNFMDPGVNEELNLPFTAQQFIDLVASLQAVPDIGGVRIYFASYQKNSPATDNYIPTGKQDLLTLIFAATDADMNDTGDYFNIDYTGTTPGPSVKTLTSQMASSWVKYYQSIKLYLLQKAAVETNPNFLETKALWHPIGDLTDWLCIVNCSGQPGCPVVTGVQASFSAYNPGENYANQLGLEFEMTDNTTGSIKPLTGDGDGGYDTGNPCPPLPGCQGGSLPTD